MSSLAKKPGAAAAAAAGSSDSPAAKKRRRWSTAQEDAVGLNRFGGKKQQQLRILGRQHPCSSSNNSLASFQSNSNPIFEPSYYGSNNSELQLGESLDGARTFQSQWNAATLTASAGGSSRGGVGKSHPSPKRFRSQKTTHPSASLQTSNGGVWGPEEDGTDSPHPLVPSRTNLRGGAYWASEESRETSVAYSEWRTEDALNQGDTLLLPPVSPGAQSIDGPRYPDDVSQLLDEDLESCERRTRELLEKVQANAAAELSQLKAHKATIFQLRADCTKYEEAAKQQAETEAQLLSLRHKIEELEHERGCEALAKEELMQKLRIVDAELGDWKSKLGFMEEQDEWRKKVEALEMELFVLKSAAAGERKPRGATIVQGGEEKKVAGEGEAMMTITTSCVTCRTVDTQLKADKGGIGSGSSAVFAFAAQALSADKLVEVQAQLAAVCEEMGKLQRQRNELRNAVLEGEKRVEEAQKERDAVVLAVQSEWDSVKVALREDKEKLVRELETIRGQKTKLERQLEDQTQKFSLMHDRGKPENDLDPSAITVQTTLQTTLDKGMDENQKLENELVEVRDHNQKLASERDALLAALVGMRDGNKKLESELSSMKDEKTKLEREREALMAVREERQKLEGERALVFKAMRGENKKLESEREVLIAMQDYLKKLEMKQDLVDTVVGGDDKRRKNKQETKSNESTVKMLDSERDATLIKGR